MPKRLPKLQIVRRRDPQTQAVNEKIARLVAVKPWGDIYATPPLYPLPAETKP